MCDPSETSSADDQTKGSLCKLLCDDSADMAVLELYAIEIQMYSDLKETRKLKVGCHTLQS